MGYLQDQGAGERAVGISSHVGGDGSQGHGEADRLRVDQPETYKPTPGIFSRKIGHARRRNGADHVSSRGSEQTRFSSC